MVLASGKACDDFVVCPFTVLVDDREGAPWHFQGLRRPLKTTAGWVEVPLVVKAESRRLKTGDYTIDGLEHLLAVERKSLDDLYGSLGGGRQRFQAEFERMQELEYSAVIVEAGWDHLLYKPPRNSQMSPRSVIGTIVAWQQRYKTQWILAPSRRFAEELCLQVLERFWRDKQAA